MNISAAGSFFTNGTHVLAGYQPHKEKPIISGIGGKCLPGELPFRTVVRETVEELFNVDEVGDELMVQLCTVVPQNIIIHNNYYIHVYSFNDLELMLGILRSTGGFVSPLYDSFPSSVYELVVNRKVLSDEKYVEISHLTLLPLICYSEGEGGIIDKYFIQDINYYLSQLNRTHADPCQQLDRAV